MTRFLSIGILFGVLSLVYAATVTASLPLMFTDLGPVSDPDGLSSAYGDLQSIGFAINASGQVVGYAGLEPQGQPYDPPATHAFLYSGGSMTDLNLGGLNGNASSTAMAFGINASGTVVGYAFNSTLSDGTRAMVTSGGSMISVDAYDTTVAQSRAYGVNASGTVVGVSYSTATEEPNAVIYNYSGTYNATTGVYSGGTWSSNNINSALGGAGGTSRATAINDAGSVTGYYTTNGSGYSAYPQAFVRTSAGAVTDLGALTGMGSSQACGINASGDVVGYAYVANTAGGPDSIGQPFLAVHGGSGYTMQLLTMPAGCDNSLAYGVNDFDMAVGIGYTVASDDADYDAMLWTNGNIPGIPAGAVDLNTLAASVLPSGWVLTSARGINDAGQITGTGTYDGNSLAFVLTVPVPEPSTLLLAGSGLAGLLGYIWRRRRAA